MNPGGQGPFRDDAFSVSAENPWPGLLSFREADERWFQGRKEEAGELLRCIKLERLTVLFALSGIGKSSLLQAGVFPALRRDGIFPVYVRLNYSAQPLDLPAQVIESIAEAGRAADVMVPLARHGGTLWEYLHNIQTEFWNRQQRRVLPLLVFDQFEEIFTLGKEEGRIDASEAFLEELADLAESTAPSAVAQRWADDPECRDDYTMEGEYKLLISLREDFLPELTDQHRRIALVPQKRYRLRQMNGEGALLAVSQAKDLVDERVAEQIVRFVSAGERFGSGRRGRSLKDLDVEPALLSVVCRELNNRRRLRNEPKISADLLEGNQEAVLQDFYERSFEGLDGRVRAFVEEQFLTVGGARARVAQDNVLAAPGMKPEVVELLVERRLLRKELLPSQTLYELTHDLLTGVVRASRDQRRQKEAEELLKKERRESDARARRSRSVAAAFGTIAIIAVVAAGFAFVKNAEARETLARVREEQKLKDLATIKAKEEEARALREKAEAVRQAEIALKAIEGQKVANIGKDAALQEARKNALDAAREALKSAKSAADAAAAEARSKANEALANMKAADLALKEEESKKLSRELAIEVKQKDAEVVRNARGNAEGKINEIQPLLASGQHVKVLGMLARALTLDPSSLPGRSWAFDQLLRGAWKPPAQPGAPGSPTFVHRDLNPDTNVPFAAFSPDRRLVASASAGNAVRLWEWESGKLVDEFKEHTMTVNSVMFSPDGRRIVTASMDSTAQIWDVSTRAKVSQLKHAKNVNFAAFSVDGRQVVTASQDGTARIWDAGSGAEIGNLDHSRYGCSVNGAAFTPDGRQVVTACGDGKARAWDRSTSTVIREYVGHERSIRSVAISTDGQRIVTASEDNKAIVWNRQSGDKVGDKLSHNSAVRFAMFSPKGERVVTASYDKSAQVWDASSGRQIGAPLRHDGFVLSAQFDSDGLRVVTASADKKVRVWDVWFNFSNPSDLVKLLEASGGLSGADDSLPALSAAERQRRVDEVRAASANLPPTHFFRWFLANRQ